MKKNLKTIALTVIIMTLITATFAHANSTGMAWDTIGDKIINALTGKFALAIAIVAVFGAACGLMFGEGGGLQQKLLKVAFGVACLFGASNIVINFFGVSGCLF